MPIKQQRKCVACREVKNQSDMLRITKIGEDYFLDTKQKLGGRGAYVCKTQACIDLTIKKRLLNRSYKCNVSTSIYELLGEYEQNN